MDIKKYSIPVSSYSRYRYNSVEAVGFYKRFNVLLKKIELNNQDYPIPIYEDPNIFVICQAGETRFTESILQYTNRQGRIEPHQFISSLDALRQENVMSTTEKVIVFSDAVTEKLAWLEEFAFNSIVVTNSEDDAALLKGKYPFIEKYSVPTTVVDRTDALAKAIDAILERIVLRRLNFLLYALKEFKEVHQKPLLANGLRKHIEEYIHSFGPGSKRHLRGWIKEINTMPELTQDLNTETVLKSLKTLESVDAKDLAENKSFYLMLDRIAQDFSKKAEQFTHDQIKKIPSKVRAMFPDLIAVGNIEEPLYEVTINSLVNSFHKGPSTKGDLAMDDVTIIAKRIYDNRESLIETLKDAAIRIKVLTEVDRRILKIKDLYEVSFHRMAWEIKGTCYRSKVPESERPGSLNENKILSPKLARRLYDKVGAVGAGYRCDKLHVYIREKSDLDESKIESDVKNVLAEFHITDFRLIMSKETVTHFKRVGAKIKVARKGTLGGFAWMKPKRKGNDGIKSTSYQHEERQLCALMSKHVVNGTDKVYLISEKNNTEINIGSVIQVDEMPCTFENPYVDIAAARILPREERECDKKFRNSRQEPSSCRLFEFKGGLEYLKGLTVHFSGATTKLGIGKITIPDFVYTTQATQIHHVVIEEDDEGLIKRFSEEGDSGSVICADTVDDNHVDVIAMLIGCMNFTDREDKNKPGQYLAFRMVDGLQKLESDTNCSFSLCTEEDEN